MSSPFFETFDNGIGALSHTWGRDFDTSVRGQVTVGGDSGMMERPWGAAAGHGYGTYTIVAKLNGNQPGPAGLLWPGNDRWPGPEMDLVEYIDGRPYGTMHYRGSDGQDVYGSIYYNGVDHTQVHTYSLDWQPGKVTFYVDGRNWGSFTDNVSRDYDHGGVNQTMSIMNRNPNTSITVYEVSYSPSGGGGSGVQQETVVQGSSTTPEIVVQTGSGEGESKPGTDWWWSAWEAAWDKYQYTDTQGWEAAFWRGVDNGNVDNFMV